MIARIWHGWTTFENADKYEHLLKEEIFIGIHKRDIKGFKEIQLLRRELENESEFVTIMWFDTMDSAKEFAGADYENTVVLPEAEVLLARFDKKSAHYEVIEKSSS